mgnify:CR=1 FL=1
MANTNDTYSYTGNSSEAKNASFISEGVENFSKILGADIEERRKLEEVLRTLSDVTRNLYSDNATVRGEAMAQYSVIKQVFEDIANRQTVVDSHIDSLLEAAEAQLTNNATKDKAEEVISDVEAIKQLLKEIREVEKKIASTDDQQIQKGLNNRKSVLETELQNRETRLTGNPIYTTFQTNNNGLDIIQEYKDHIQSSTTALNNFQSTQQSVRDNMSSTERTIDSCGKTWEKFGKYVSAVGSAMWNHLKGIRSVWVEYDDMATKSGRSWGLNTVEVANYRKTLLESASAWSDTFGLQQGDIEKLQNDVISATGKVKMLTTESMQNYTAISKLINPETVKEGVKAFENFGASSNRAVYTLHQVYEDSSQMGLDASKTASAFAKNIALASSHTFSKGVDGIRRMTTLSETLRFNMESVARAASDKFGTIESSVETAAQLQMLGGSYAMNYGNPLDVMYDALNDMEGFTQRFVDTFKGKGTFNEKTGMVDISALDKQFIKASAKVMGMSETEAFNVAQSSIINEKVKSEINDSVKNSLTDKQLTAIYNRAQWNDEEKTHYITYYDAEEGKNKEKRVSDLTSLEEISQIISSPIEGDMEANVESIAKDVSYLRQRLYDRARTSVSQKEREAGYDTKIKAMRARDTEGINAWIKDSWASLTDEKNDSLWAGGYRFFNSIWGSAVGSTIIEGGMALWKSIDVNVSDILKWLKFNTLTGGNTLGKGKNLLNNGGNVAGKGGNILSKGGNLLKKIPWKRAGVGAAVAAAGYGVGEYADYRKDNGKYGNLTDAATVSSRVLELGGLGLALGGVFGGVAGGLIGAGVGAYEVSKESARRAEGVGVVTNGAVPKYKQEKTNEEKVVDSTSEVSEKMSQQNDTLESTRRSVEHIDTILSGKGDLPTSNSVTSNESRQYYESESSTNTSITNNMSQSVEPKPSEMVEPKPIEVTNSFSTEAKNTSSVSNVQSVENRITVDDIKVDVSGKITLEGGGGSAELNINELLQQRPFIQALTDKIVAQIESMKNYGGNMNVMNMNFVNA